MLRTTCSGARQGWSAQRLFQPFGINSRPRGVEFYGRTSRCIDLLYQRGGLGVERGRSMAGKRGMVASVRGGEKCLEFIIPCENLSFRPTSCSSVQPPDSITLPGVAPARRYVYPVCCLHEPNESDRSKVIKHRQPFRRIHIWNEKNGITHLIAFSLEMRWNVVPRNLDETPARSGHS